jgi:hypothetical protein
MSFVGTPNCYVCNKKVYPVERMDADKKTFHKYALSTTTQSLGLMRALTPFGRPLRTGVASAVRTAIAH